MTRALSRKTHDLLSVALLVPLARLRRAARPSTRPALLAFYQGMAFRERARVWPLEKKREWILHRLRFSVRRAAVESVYYQQLFKRIGFDPSADFGFEEFSSLPVLGRGDVRRAGRALLSSAVARDQLRKDSTGGSTGEPTVVWLGPEERGWRESGGEWFMRQIGVRPGTRTALLWGHHLDPVAKDSPRERFHAFESNCRWLDCFRLSPAALEQYHHQFERWRPACIIAYASALGHLAEHILAAGHLPSYPTRCFVTGAEKLTSGHREAIDQAFNRPVHERYGGRDVGGLGFQTRPGRALDYDVDWANVLMEPETEEPSSAILVTKLHADGMPMLRYRIGDTGRFPPESRPGWPTFVLHEVLGREGDRIWLPDGRWINAIQMPHMMKDYPVREFMLVQRSDYSVELNIVPRPGFGAHARNSIINTIKANLPSVNLRLNLVDEIPRTRANKRQLVVSEVKPSPGV